MVLTIPYLPIPNLAQLGVKRKTTQDTADLITIQDSPYPVLANYRKLCAACNWIPFNGGTPEKQGPKGSKGYITSGYRDEALEGRSQSPHGYAIALDIVSGGPADQIQAALRATDYFTRVGLYPQNGIIHVDLAPDEWIKRFNGSRSWVRIDGKYRTFPSVREACEFVKINFK